MFRFFKQESRNGTIPLAKKLAYPTVSILQLHENEKHRIEHTSFVPEKTLSKMKSYLTTGATFFTARGLEGAKAEAALAPITRAARVRRGAIVVDL